MLKEAKSANPDAQIPRNDKTYMGSSRSACSCVLRSDDAIINAGGTTEGRILRQLAIKPFAEEKCGPLGSTSIIVLQYREFDTAYAIPKITIVR